ncbi:MAG: CPBP family intramembrane metalloprotease [Muribaculum sp.]|nr:CPBP family intramembrane metalloprotease [Muribaculum sp.]
MEELAQTKKVFSRLGWCYIAGTATVYVVQIVVGYFVGVYKPEWASNMSISLILSSLVTYGCGMPLIVLLAQGMETQTIERHKMKWWQFIVALIMCYSLMYISNILGTIVTTAIGMVKGSQVDNNLVSYITSNSMLVNFVLMVVVAPIVEEYVFRKVIVDRTVKYGQGIAIVTSGLMFGLFHGNLNQFAYAVGLGAFFAFIYIKTGNLKITIGMHAIINFMGSTVAGLLLKMLDYDKLLAMDPNDTDAMMGLFMENIGAWALFGLYALCLFVLVVIGVILFIVFFKRFKVEPGTVQIPKGKGFSVLILNPGMLTFCIVWLILIVLQLIM